MFILIVGFDSFMIWLFDVILVDFLLINLYLLSF